MKFVPVSVSRKVSRAALLTRHKSPQILFAAGVVGVVATTVMAARATLQLEDILDDVKKDFDRVDEAVEQAELRDLNYDPQRDRLVIWALGAGKIARLYGPTLLMGTASIACLTGSHVILQNRNNQLTAAYIALDQAYQQYRERVTEKYGPDEMNTYVDVVDEKGKVIKKVQTGPNGYSQYARLFDEINSKQWSAEEGYNLIFVRQQQNWANDMFNARGHIMLNEVYDLLGLSRTEAGFHVGWVLGYNPDENYVDFGLDVDTEAARAFRNGYEPNVWLDFNVQGPVTHLIEKAEARR